MVRDAIHDEVVREHLDELGLKHFLDVRATVRSLLEHLARLQRAAYAAVVAERLLHEHESLPARERAAYATDWRPALDMVWRGLSGDATAEPELAHAIGCFYLSPNFADRRRDDPTDMPGNAALAAFYAAECYLHGCVEFATWTGWRGFDTAAVHAAGDRDWPRRRPPEVDALAWELAHPAIQAELDLQLAEIELISAEGADLLEDTARDTFLKRLRRLSG
ncbi:hypothetical protein CS0771_52600 [Catellatospora sp. IY07-71]|uniref:hypothetical protein n=1 Tax=Catellatospora sp. IY07-71 TaxID=2728827 RepID=UPI001BB33D54|nr:hypothetical protein [Catellatospora sp. IY07-71]BCJ75716.1 hypothetical protein CS0771_52600 [Catellatospora sp. IY07-71]